MSSTKPSVHTAATTARLVHAFASMAFVVWAAAPLLADDDTPLFERLEAPSAPEHVYRTGASGERYLPEIMGGGGALLDFDRDGDLDLFLVQGGPLGPRVTSSERPADQLYRNEMRSGEPETLRFVPANGSGIREGEYGMGAASADFDRDGLPDLYVLNLGPNELWRNRGDGSFEAVGAAAGVDDPGWSTAASPADFDGDGWIDLYVVNYVDFQFHRHRQCPAPSSALDYCGPLNFPGSADRMFRNLGVDSGGHLRFEDVSRAAGLLSPEGRGLGSSVADFDRDGRLDLYVANDQMANELWLNLGTLDGRTFVSFSDEALLAGVAVNGRGEPEASMGVATADFDRDGDLDIFLSHLSEETNTLYVNDGRALFLDRTAETGLAVPSFPFTGFGAVWLDLENDGWLDLAVVNGTIKSIDAQRATGDPLPLRQSNQIFRQLPPDPGSAAVRPGTTPDARFEEISHRGGEAFTRAAVSRGLMRGDLDDDGDSDLVLVDLDEPVKILLNTWSRRRSGENRWVGLRLVDVHGGQAPGAVVRVTTTNGAFTALAHTDGSYLSAHDERVLVGTGTGTASAVDVLWPSGRVEQFVLDGDRQYHTLREGDGRTPSRNER